MTSPVSRLVKLESTMLLQIETIRSFVTKAEQVYRDCFKLLGCNLEAYSLDYLIWAARRGNVPRRGQVARANGAGTITFHVHGMGYTFQDSIRNNEYRFNVATLDGATRLTFSSWSFQQYLKSMQNDSSQEDIENALRRLSLEWTSLVHVHHELTSYFYCQSTSDS